MISKERIEQYKIWFENLSFFGNNCFVIDKIEYLWNLVNYIGSKYQKFCNCNIGKNEKYAEITLDECIIITQSFFDNHKIFFNINKLIEEKVLVLKDNTNKQDDKFYYSSKDGSSYYDENKNKRILVIIDGSIFDSAVLIHEITHYRNQPNNKRNFTNDLLTESLSYAMELIFFEDLKDSIYKSDRELHFRLFERLLYEYSYQIYYIYKIIYLYKKEKDISRDKYDKIFDDGMYDKTLEQFERYVSQKKSVLKDTWIIIGLPLAIYMLDEYRKDKMFFNLLEKFNDAIMTNKSIEECLTIIGINSDNELINKIKNSTDSFIQILEQLYEKNNEIRK